MPRLLRGRFQLVRVTAATASVFVLVGCSAQAAGFNAYKAGEETDLIAFESVTDESGTYLRTVLDPAGISFNNQTQDMTDEQLTPIRDAVVKFVTLEAIDSIALDNAARFDEWGQTVAPFYVSSQHLNDVLTALPYDGGTRSNVILQDTDDVVPTLLRDGGVRVADKRISEVTFTGASSAVEVLISGNAVIFADDAVLGPWSTKETLRNSMSIPMYNGDGSVMTAEQVQETFKDYEDQTPSFSDGKPNSALLSFTLSFTYLQEGGRWKISASSNSFRFGTFAGGDNGQLPYRDKVTK